MKSLDIEQIKEILRIEIRKQILHSHRVREGTNRWDDDGIKRSLDSIQKKETILKDMLKSDSKVQIDIKRSTYFPETKLFTCLIAAWLFLYRSSRVPLWLASEIYQL